MSTDLGRGFEERLLLQLRQVVTDRSELLGASATEPAADRQRRWKRKLALAAAGIAVAFAVAVATPLISLGSGSTAYALSRHEDGTISVKIYRLHSQAEADALERDLEAAGVPDAEVYYRGDKICPGGRPNPLVTAKWLSVGEADAGNDRAGGLTLDPADLRGGVLILDYYTDQTTEDGQAVDRMLIWEPTGPTGLDMSNLPPCVLPTLEADSS
jgi:hypothetical protein